MKKIPLDNIEKISVDRNDYFNECKTLSFLREGLKHIADTLKNREFAWEQRTGSIKSRQLIGMIFTKTRRQRKKPDLNQKTPLRFFLHTFHFLVTHPSRN